ncbi:hypothetical protein (nucleomorph) [Guillardia theta]|uniref:Uncharacterized protein n=1 Tax=Guillardia theta TaxID=55529 RepID=Q98RM5_GUITH|nr:hypothetical protein GTHECHR1130 [Guillardia theta]AAK39923.1 hypothetical protein [Guillardia theta]
MITFFNMSNDCVDIAKVNIDLNHREKKNLIFKKKFIFNKDLIEINKSTKYQSFVSPLLSKFIRLFKKYPICFLKIIIKKKNLKKFAYYYFNFSVFLHIYSILNYIFNFFFYNLKINASKKNIEINNWNFTIKKEILNIKNTKIKKLYYYKLFFYLYFKTFSFLFVDSFFKECSSAIFFHAFCFFFDKFFYDSYKAKIVNEINLHKNISPIKKLFLDSKNKFESYELFRSCYEILEINNTFSIYSDLTNREIIKEILLENCFEIYKFKRIKMNKNCSRSLKYSFLAFKNIEHFCLGSRSKFIILIEENDKIFDFKHKKNWIITKNFKKSKIHIKSLFLVLFNNFYNIPFSKYINKISLIIHDYILIFTLFFFYSNKKKTIHYCSSINYLKLIVFNPSIRIISLRIFGMAKNQNNTKLNNNGFINNFFIGSFFYKSKFEKIKIKHSIYRSIYSNTNALFHKDVFDYSSFELFFSFLNDIDYHSVFLKSSNIQTILNISYLKKKIIIYYKLAKRFSNIKIFEILTQISEKIFFCKAKFLITNILIKKKKYTSAKKQVILAISLNKSSFKLWFTLGYICFLLKDYFWSLKYYHKSLLYKPKNKVFHNIIQCERKSINSKKLNLRYFQLFKSENYSKNINGIILLNLIFSHFNYKFTKDYFILSKSSSLMYLNIEWKTVSAFSYKLFNIIYKYLRLIGNFSYYNNYKNFILLAEIPYSKLLESSNRNIFKIMGKKLFLISVLYKNIFSSIDLFNWIFNFNNFIILKVSKILIKNIFYS